MAMKPIGMMEVKQAFHDERFRDLFPEIRHMIDDYLKKPHCGACAMPVIREIINKWPDRVQKYFPGRVIVRPEDEAKKLAENNWLVINCHIDELEDRLRKLPPGRKQLAICRYEEYVTVVINELAVIF
jgi:hypothetical protein